MKDERKAMEVVKADEYLGQLETLRLLAIAYGETKTAEAIEQIIATVTGQK